jgi:hypothetical protein
MARIAVPDFASLNPGYLLCYISECGIIESGPQSDLN